ncbi:MAG: ATP synthase F1 subunit delta [Anaerovorax sp.]
MAELTVDLTYGKALFEAAADTNKTEDILKEAEEMVKLFESESAFFNFIISPVISAAEKRTVIEKVFGGRICQELMNLLYVLIDKGRTRHFAKIVARYKILIDDSNGYTLGNIFTVNPIQPKQLHQFEAQVGKLLKKKVKLENKIDPKIIGGVRIFIDGKVIDATIKKRLLDLKDSLR